MATSFEQLKIKKGPVAPESTSAFEALKQKAATTGLVSRETQAPAEPTTAFGKAANFLAPTATKAFGKLRSGEGITGRDIVGSALELGSYIVPAGAVARAAGFAVKGAKALSTAQKIKQGAAAGATIGAMGETGRAIGEGEGVGGTITRAAGGALAGGVLGGTASGAIQAVRAPFAARAAQKAEEKALFEAGEADSRIATKKLEGGKIVTDKVASEAVKQGIPEADVALIKGSTPTDRTKMARMLDIREKQLTNKRITDRATDVVGESFVENIAKPIEKLNKDAGKQLNVVAQRLVGKKIDPSPAVTKFASSLDDAGVKVRKNGTLSFRDSNFQGLPGVQRLISNVWMRTMKVARTGDAHQAHQLKSYIDEIVNYGKHEEGLSGKAQTMLKQFRREVDTILDSKFSAYNKVNTQYSDTIQQLNNMGVAIGRKFRLGDTFADTQSGLAMRRILSNTQSRAEILKLLEGMQGTAKKYGIKINDDIISQANFADTLEKMFGTEAPTSLLGQFSKGLETFGSTQSVEGLQQVGSAGSEFMRGNLIRGSIKAGVHVADALRGVSQENRIKALRALLGEGNAPKTVFGKNPLVKNVAEKKSNELVPKTGDIAHRENETNKDWLERVSKEHNIGEINGIPKENIKSMKIFGSSIEGKKKPNDIDVFVTVKNDSMKFPKKGGLPSPIIKKQGKVQYFIMPESDADDLLQSMLYTGRKDADRGFSGRTINIPKTVFGKKKKP